MKTILMEKGANGKPYLKTPKTLDNQCLAILWIAAMTLRQREIAPDLVAFLESEIEKIKGRKGVAA